MKFKSSGLLSHMPYVCVLLGQQYSITSQLLRADLAMRRHCFLVCHVQVGVFLFFSFTIPSMADSQLRCREVYLKLWLEKEFGFHLDGKYCIVGDGGSSAFSNDC